MIGDAGRHTIVMVQVTEIERMNLCVYVCVYACIHIQIVGHTQCLSVSVYIHIYLHTTYMHIWGIRGA